MNQGGEIVVYRNDKSIVLYNQAGQIRALTIYDNDISEYTEESSGNMCPFCGSVLTGDKYNYIAKAYFNLLQNSFQNTNSGFGGTGAGFSPNTTYANHLSRLSNDAESVSARRSDSVGGSEEGDEEVIMEMPKNIPKYLLITGYYKQFFIEGRKLGSGSYGHVFNCIHILDELVLGEYAVKKLPIGDDMGWLKNAIKEIKVRENIRHKNVVDYNHSWLEMFRMNEMCPYIPYLFILMEYCNGGNLDGFIQTIYGGNCGTNGSSREVGDRTSAERIHVEDDRSEGSVYVDEQTPKNNVLDDDEVLMIFVDIVSGLDHLHKNFIIHRDLKPSNILLKFTHNSGTAMISDFGTCEIFSQKSSKYGFTGTIEYTAPELLVNTRKYLNKTSDRRRESPYSEGTIFEYEEQGAKSMYNNKVDMWSLGVILYYISYGRLPFYSYDMNECVKLILESELVIPGQPQRSKLITTLITNLLSKNPSERLDCSHILNIYEINRYLANNRENQQIRNSLYQRFIQFF